MLNLVLLCGYMISALETGIQKCHEIILSVFAQSVTNNPQEEELTR